jgi:hypothetical protein
MVDKPAQTVEEPVTMPALGNALTVILVETEEVAQADVTE